jgi:glycosyltransferase involved in cell wall biosynthesis
MIVIATDDIGGPGKGLFQFLKHAPPGELNYVLCNFDIKDRPAGQFIDEARRLGLNLVLLEQTATIDPGLITRARQIIKEHGVDILQTHGHKPNVLGCLLHTFYGIPWIAFAHGYIDGSRKTRIYNKLDQRVLRYADRVVAVAESMRKRARDEFKVRDEKIRLIHNAIELPDADAPAANDDLRRVHGLLREHRVVAAIGRLSPEKDQMTLLRALPRVAAAVPDVRLLLVGDGPDRALLEAHCDDNRLRDRVVFTGYQENINAYYRILDLLVLPSRLEGHPNTVLEAMSFGVPVLASRVGGVPEIIDGPNGVMVEPGDPIALADRMIELLRDEGLRRTIGANGRNSLYPKFSPERRAREIMSVYDELVPRPSLLRGESRVDA